VKASGDRNINKHRILIADDEAATRDVLLAVLSPSFECQAVSSRDEALMVIKSGFIPACILMDYTMPGLPLRDFLKEIAPAKSEIILMIGRDESLAIRGLAGVMSSLQKPFPPGVVLRVVERMLGSSEL
jgi:DNA-binding NtrC family response regulator